MQKKSALIVTDNLAGFITAQILHHRGFDVTLVDTDQEPRSAARFQHLGLPFYRSTSQFRHGLRELAEALSLAVSAHEVELPPQTVNNNETRAFVGFGESKAPALQPLSQYNHAERLTLSKSERDIVQALLSRDDFKYVPLAEITGIQMNASAVERVTLAGGQSFAADNYIFMTNLLPWLSLLPHEALGLRTRSRIAKAHVWSRVLVELTHAAPVRTDENVFVLTPNQADHNPCAGQFKIEPALSGVAYKTVWETYVQNERLEDSEYVAAEIRALRKMVKKAFPEAETAGAGILSITPQAYSDLHWVFTQKDLHEVAKNLFIFPALGADSLGFAQSVECASWSLDAVDARLEAVAQHSPQAEENTPSLL